MSIRREFGSTGLQVSPLCLGGNVFGWTCDEEASFAVLDAYVEAGGNFIDTATVYSVWVPGNVGAHVAGTPRRSGACHQGGVPRRPAHARRP
jgi:aryl-alcohol dehydrogenase-like predicted oxidoreductase